MTTAPAPVTLTETVVADVESGQLEAAGAHLLALRGELDEFVAKADAAIFGELQAFKAQADFAAKLKAEADKLEVKDEATAALAATAQNAAHTRAQALEVMRTSVTKPTLAFKRSVDALFDEPKQLLEAAKQTFGRKAGAFRAAEAARKAAELAAAAATAKTAEEHRSVIVASTAPPPSISGSKDTMQIELEITNPDAVPRAFCSPDESKIKAAARAALKAGDGPPKIDGVTIRFVPTTSPTGRGGLS